MKALVLVPFALLLTAPTVQAQTAPKKQLQAFYDELNALLLKKQAEKVERLMMKRAHPQFTFIHLDGRRQNRKECLAEMKASLAPQNKMLKSTTRLDDLSVAGDATRVKTHGEWAMEMKGPDGKPHTIVGITKTTDVWVQEGGVWKLKEVRTTSEKLTMDGKPFKM